MSVHDWIPRRPYDEEVELTAYVWTHLHRYLAEDELQWQRLYIRMQMYLRGRRSPWEMDRERIERAVEQEISDFDWFHLQDPQAYLDQVRRRIVEEHGEEIDINRCLSCDGVLRTPKATHCFWGGQQGGDRRPELADG